MLTAQQYELKAPVRARLRVLLVLGRVSNLPTVWSNCLAAWLIADGVDWHRFTLICGSATFLYVGGMFLNDAFDAEFDHQHRAERPIPAGEIARRTVWIMGFGWLGLGWLTAAFAGMLPCAVGTLLLLTIVIYDWGHKRFRGAAWFMASCRLLLYLFTASAVAGIPSIKKCVLAAVALFAYIMGLSLLARLESGAGRNAGLLKMRSFRRGGPLWLLFVPVITSLVLGWRIGGVIWLAAAIQAGWLLWCITCRLAKPAFFRAGVAGLLAGIPLVDWLNTLPTIVATAPVFLGMFVLALALQRWAPAT